MKAFFGKIWAWVLAHKLIAGIIAGAAALVITTAVVVPVSVSAAKKRKAQEQETQHTHSWSNAWSSDATNHWHKCSGCDEIKDKAAHTFGEWKLGAKDKEERECSVCGYKEEKAHSHNYVFDSFVWTETTNAYTAKAKYVCSADSSIDLRDATVTKDLDKSVAWVCEEEHPKNEWVASYDGHQDTKTENLEPIHHDWQAESWVWTGYTTAQVHLVCSHDANHIHDVTATGGDITNEVTTPANCSTPGVRTYTASVTYAGHNFTDTKTEPVAATGVHTLDSWGFCTSGHEYRGVTIETLNSDFEVDTYGEYYFRIPIEGASHY